MAGRIRKQADGTYKAPNGKTYKSKEAAKRYGMVDEAKSEKRRSTDAVNAMFDAEGIAEYQRKKGFQYKLARGGPEDTPAARKVKAEARRGDDMAQVGSTKKGSKAWLSSLTESYGKPDKKKSKAKKAKK